MRTTMIWLTGVLLGAIVCHGARAENKVLVVHSYHQTYDWTREVDREITAILKKARVTAQMALELLKGKSAGEIPMVINQDGRVLVNLKTICICPSTSMST